MQRALVPWGPWTCGSTAQLLGHPSASAGPVGRDVLTKPNRTTGFTLEPLQEVVRSWLLVLLPSGRCTNRFPTASLGYTVCSNGSQGRTGFAPCLTPSSSLTSDKNLIPLGCEITGS